MSVQVAEGDDPALLKTQQQLKEELQQSKIEIRFI
jgi:hypothetical protein